MTKTLVGNGWWSMELPKGWGTRRHKEL